MDRRTKVIKDISGVPILVSSLMENGYVAIVDLDGRRVVACNLETSHLLEEEIRRRLAGEPSIFEALWEELDAPVI